MKDLSSFSRSYEEYSRGIHCITKETIPKKIFPREIIDIHFVLTEAFSNQLHRHIQVLDEIYLSIDAYRTRSSLPECNPTRMRTFS